MLLSKFKVTGFSMEPSLKHGQTLLASSLPYLFLKPKIGDLVLLLKDRYIIKRITKIKQDKFFVLGDNREGSTDSRNFGWVSKDELVGKVVCII